MRWSQIAEVLAHLSVKFNASSELDLSLVFHVEIFKKYTINQVRLGSQIQLEMSIFPCYKNQICLTSNTLRIASVSLSVC
jgi:hypothetical protein